MKAAKFGSRGLGELYEHWAALLCVQSMHLVTPLFQESLPRLILKCYLTSHRASQHFVLVAYCLGSVLGCQPNTGLNVWVINYCPFVVKT